MRLDTEVCGRIGGAWGASTPSRNLLVEEVHRLQRLGAKVEDDCPAAMGLRFDNGFVTLWSIDPLGSALPPTAFYEDGSVLELKGI